MNNQITEKKYLVENVKYPTLESIAEAYKDNGVTLFGLQKALQRGHTGDNLIPRKKRKGYIPPPSKEKNLFIVAGMPFNSKKDACRKQNVKYETFQHRLRAGWSFEEALGFKIRHKGRKDNNNSEIPNFNNGNEDISSNKKFTNRKYTKYQKIGKEVTANGKRFPSIVAAAEFYGKKIDNVRLRLSKGASIEQSLDLEPYITSKSIKYKEKIYQSKKALALKLGLKPSQIYRIPNEDNLEQAIEELLQKKVVRGKRNEKFYLNRPELGSSKGFIYFSSYIHPTIKPDPGKCFFKVGITQNLKKRNANLRYVDNSWSLETTQLQASRTEAMIKNVLADKLTNKLSSKDLDGKGEIFELTIDESKKAKICISLDLKFQNNRNKVKKYPKIAKKTFSRKGH